MSLIVWLPLNGNLNNKGCKEVTITAQSGVTVDSTGKIGSCYTSDGSTNGTLNDFEVTLSNFTLAAWIRINTQVKGWKCPFKLLNNNSVAERQYIGFCCENTNGTQVGFHFFKKIGNTNTAIFDSYIDAPPVGEWQHLAVTYDGKYARYYRNGVNIGEVAVSASNQNTVAEIKKLAMFGATGDYQASTTKTSLNDIRIYDYALSPSEVKEISKGLLCHYRLDGVYGGTGENLYTGSRNFSGTWINSNYWTTDSEKYMNFTVKTRSSTWSGLYQNVPCTLGDKFTISFYAKIVSGGTMQSILSSNLGQNNGVTLRGGNFSSSGSSFWVKETDDGTYWKRYWATAEVTGSTVTTLKWEIDNSISNKQMWICGLKMEKGSTPTPWTPAPTDIGIDTTLVPDSSGYGHHGTINGSVSLVGDSRVYNNCLSVDNNTTTCTISPGIKTSDGKFSFNIWLNIKEYVSKSKFFAIRLSDSLFFNFGPSSDSKYQFFVFYPSYFINIKTSLWNLNEWHMWTGTHDGTTSRLYMDGVLGWTRSTHTSYTVSTSDYQYLLGGGTDGDISSKYLASNARIYSTVLSEEDIKALYQTEASITNGNNAHTGEFSETGAISIGNNTVITSENICELAFLSKLKYDPNVYIEPDGSAWVRIFHHNNPASYLFASNNSFTTGVYIDKNRWFNFDICDDVSSWELMIKQKALVTDSESKYRWIQTVNPMTATYAQTTNAYVTKITTSGYTTPESYFGGIWKQNTKAYIVANNMNESNWWGAIGSWTLSNGALPSYNNATITTGYVDLYLRIDNLPKSNISNVSLHKSNAILAKQFIEV